MKNMTYALQHIYLLDHLLNWPVLQWLQKQV